MSASRTILITGSQRSGTTMLHLIMDSHSNVTGIDEDAFNESKLNEYYADAPTEYLSLKLPNYVHAFERFNRLPNLRVLFCVRDPRDVVTSMLTLNLQMGGGSVPWVAHPFGGAIQIYHCARLIAEFGKQGLEQLLGEYPMIAVKPPAARTRQENVYSAALCWRLINQLLPIYRKVGVRLGVVPYESLVSDPKSILTEMADFLELPFEPQMLEHDKLHEGTSIGGTENTRSIDTASVGKWQDSLSSEELAVIRSQCATVATRFGYQL